MREASKAIWIAPILAALAACGGDVFPPESSGGSAGSGSSAGSGGLDPGQVEPSELTRAASCDELLDALQGELKAYVRWLADYARRSPYPQNAALSARSTAFRVAAPAAAAGVGETEAVATPSSLAPDPAPSFAAADILQADGDRIYMVDRQNLDIFQAWPAPDLRLLASVPIEGVPVSLTVHGARALVVSNIFSTLPGQEARYVHTPDYRPVFTKLTLVDTIAEPPAVVREFYVEGNAAGSARHGGVAHNVVQQYYKLQVSSPNISYADIFGHPRPQAHLDRQLDAWLEVMDATIEESTLVDYLPATFERIDGELVERSLGCDEFLLPPAGEAYLGAASVIGLDLDDPSAAIENVSVAGWFEEADMGESSLILRKTDEGPPDSPAFGLGTRLYWFGFDGTRATFTASGRIPGYIAFDTPISERDGVLRMAVNTPTFGTGTREQTGNLTRVLTLEADGERLRLLGTSPDFGENLRVHAASFAGSRVHILLDAEQDPQLQVVDLSDPSSPALAAPLFTAGFTSVFVPLPEDRVLAVESVGGFSDVRSLALELIDESDPLEPVVAQRLEYPAPTQSSAVYDRAAVGWHPEQHLLALPLQDGTGVQSLEVYRVAAADGLTTLGRATPAPTPYNLVECLALLGYQTYPEYVAEVEADPALVAAILTECSAFSPPMYLLRALFRAHVSFTITDRDVSAYSLDALAGPPLGRAIVPASRFF